MISYRHTSRKLFLSILMLLFLAVTLNLLYLYYLAPKEQYPEDSSLFSTKAKRALVVVAHDDDAVLFSGTLAMLSSAGWEISFITFYNRDRDPEVVPLRKLEMKRMADILHIKSLELHNLTLRKESNTRETWKPIPYYSFAEVYKIDSLDIILSTAIDEYKPSIIFTLDSQIGFYGNPEHVLTAQRVEKIFKQQSADPGFPVKKIYQFTTPGSYAQKVLGGTYEIGKEIYQVSGMPEPDVQIDISNFGSTKKSVATTFESQKSNLKRYIPYLHLYPGWLYYSIFDHEYFRIIELNELTPST